MGPKPLLPEIPDMFRPRLDEQLKMSHPLDWSGEIDSVECH